MKKRVMDVINFPAWLVLALVGMRMDAETIEGLQLNLLDIQEQIETIQARADAEKRDISEDEQTEMGKLFAEFDVTEQNIERRQRIDSQKTKLASGTGRQTDPKGPQAQFDPHTGEPVKPAAPRRAPAAVIDPAERGKGGFRSFGDFAMAVCSSSMKGAVPDARLVMNAPTTYGNESVGTDGAFAVPPDFRSDIMVKVSAEDSVLGMTDQMTSSSNTLVIPTDETTPWQTSGGIQAYWEGEGNQFTQSKPSLQNTTIRLNKLTALVPVTEELLDDASAMDTYLRRKAPEKIDFKITDAIFNGTGAGMPLGILNSPCLVTVAKEGSQPADTILAENLIKMWSRCYGRVRGKAAWFYNQDIEPQVMTAAINIKNVAGTENVGGFPVFIPAGGLSSTPYATLFGRPMIPTEAAQTLGDEGDIVLGAMDQYLTSVKTGGIRQDVSIHLWFDYDIVAFRFVIRVAGQPWFSAPIARKNGTNTLSPFVSLAVRA